MITVTGAPGSGFEFCDPTQQTLTRGSQYQTSFLPEMTNGQEYKVNVKTTYKDYVPHEFVMDVRYIPNLDGKTKFIDIGTHILRKPNSPKSSSTYKFTMHGVTDEKVDDDLENYQFSLSDAQFKQYYKLDDQENVIEINSADSKTVPKLGENKASISDENGVFYPNERSFFNY